MKKNANENNKKNGKSFWKNTFKFRIFWVLVVVGLFGGIFCFFSKNTTNLAKKLHLKQNSFAETGKIALSPANSAKNKLVFWWKLLKICKIKMVVF